MHHMNESYNLIKYLNVHLDEALTALALSSLAASVETNFVAGHGINLDILDPVRIGLV